MTHLIACQSCRRQYDVGAMATGERVRCACGKGIVVPVQEPHVARILHCSACGGDVGDDASPSRTGCRYCGCEITAAERNMGPACPMCFARLGAKALFCTECGVAIKPELVRTTPVDASCPRCTGGLVARELDGMTLTDCTRCGGLWLDANAFESLVQERDTKRLSSVAVTAAPPRPEAAPRDDVRYLECLVCKKLMQRKNFAGCSGVIIDWCRDHGVWFDARELEAIVRFIEQGGLDKAEKRELKRRQPQRPIASPSLTSGPTGGHGYSGSDHCHHGHGDSWLPYVLWAVVEVLF